MKQKKEIRITLRLTPEQYETIVSKADTAQMSVSAYVRAAALRHRVVVVDGLREITHELKGIGRSLNQLTVLCNMGRIKADGNRHFYQIPAAVRWSTSRCGRLCIAETQNPTGGRQSVGQRTELHTTAGCPGVSSHPTDAPEK